MPSPYQLLVPNGKSAEKEGKTLPNKKQNISKEIVSFLDKMGVVETQSKREKTKQPNKKQKILESPVQVEFAPEIIGEILTHVTPNKKTFKNLSLVSKSFRFIMLRVSNMKLIHSELMYQISRQELTLHFECILQNCTFDLSTQNCGALRYACHLGQLFYVEKILKLAPQPIGKYDPNFSEALRKCCEKGHKNLVQVLLNDSRVNPSYMCNISLLTACKYGYFDIVELLLQDPRVTPNYQALCEACECGNTEIIKLLLSRGVSPVNKENKAFWRACQGGHLDAVCLLLNDSRLNPCEPKNEPIFRASYRGQLAIVQLLLKNEKVIAAIDNYDKNGPRELNDRILQAACESGNKELVDLLLADRRFGLTWKSVFSAAARGHPSILEVLLQDPRIILDMLMNGIGRALGGYNEAANRACANGHVEIVKKLLENENINPFANQENPGIVRASGEGHLEIVQMLVGDRRCTSQHRNEALFAACFKGKTEVARYLLTMADPSVPTNKKIITTEYKLPFEAACGSGQVEILKLLLEDNRVKVSNTGLILACAKGQLSVVETLLTRVEPEFDAFVKACEGGFVEIVKLLLKDKRINPAEMDNAAFIKACSAGRTEVVEVLLAEQSVNPCAQDVYGLRCAILQKYVKIYKMLLKDDRVNPKRKKFKIPNFRKECQGSALMDTLLKC